MNAYLRPLMLSLPLWLALPAGAQPPAARLVAASPQPAGTRVERITHEDAFARIDELRVGGQTQSIDVQPGNGAPAYQIQPSQDPGGAGHGASRPTGNTGRSSWRILNF